MFIIGVDPGASGALTMLDPTDESIIEIADMPIFKIKIGSTISSQTNVSALLEILQRMKSRGPAHVYVEQVGATPGMGAVQMFRFGEGFGIIKGILAGLLLPTTFIPPAEWKRVTRTPRDKDGARLRACQLFPVWAAAFHRTKDDGRAESALLGLYGARHSRSGVRAAA